MPLASGVMVAATWRDLTPGPSPARRGEIGERREAIVTTLYLILLTYVRAPEEVAAHLEEHRAYLRRAYAEGHFIVSGPRVPAEGGVILARAASEDDVRALIRTDPFSQRGIAEYQVIAFNALWSAPQFAPFLALPAQPASDDGQAGQAGYEGQAG